MPLQILYNEIFQCVYTSQQLQWEKNNKWKWLRKKKEIKVEWRNTTNIPMRKKKTVKVDIDVWLCGVSILICHSVSSFEQIPTSDNWQNQIFSLWFSSLFFINKLNSWLFRILTSLCMQCCASDTRVAGCFFVFSFFFIPFAWRVQTESTWFVFHAGKWQNE